MKAKNTSNNNPTITLTNVDEFIKCIIPKLFSFDQSEAKTSKNAKKKFTIIVVNVNRKFGIE